MEIPFIEIRRPASYRPLDESLQNLASYDWLILTSVNGVEALFERMEKCKVGAAALAGTNPPEDQRLHAGTGAAATSTKCTEPKATGTCNSAAA